MGATSKRLVRLVLCGLLAAASTAAVYLVDRQRAGVLETQSALKWAHQIVSQAESMELNAREAGEKDPLGWTIDYLALGVEPRLVRISRFTAEAAQLQSPENFQINHTTGIFDYTRILGLDPTKGLRIQIDLQAAGVLTSFLGTRSRATHDAAVGALFVLLFLGFFSFTGFLAPKPEPEPLQSFQAVPPPRLPISDRALKVFKASVTEWSGNSRVSLTVLGTHIRDLIKQAQAMTAAAKASKLSTAELREKIHEGLSEVHESRTAFKEAARLAACTETLLQTPASLERDRKLGLLLDKLRTTCEENALCIQTIERSIEPWATDADLAHEAQNQVTEAAEQMDFHIQKTKEALLDQARLLQALQKNAKTGEEDLELIA